MRSTAILLAAFVAAASLAGCGGGGGSGTNNVVPPAQQPGLTVSEYSGYGNQTIAAGTQNVMLGCGTFSPVSSESGETLSPVEVDVVKGDPTQITDFTLKDNATGATLGAVITAPAASNAFASLNVGLPTGSSKALCVFGNIGTTATGTIQLAIGTGTSAVDTATGKTVTLASAVLLQTITVTTESGGVTATSQGGVSQIVLAGATNVCGFPFSFTSSDEPRTVKNLGVLVPNAAASSVASVSLSYKDVNGTTQTASSAVAENGDGSWEAKFTNQTFSLPQNEAGSLQVCVSVPTIASGAVSGAAITATLDAANFLAVDANGNSVTTFNGGTDLAASNMLIVRQTTLTFEQLSTDGPMPAGLVYRFSLTADPAGDAEWAKLLLNLQMSSNNVSLTCLYLFNEQTGTVITDVCPAIDGNGNLAFDLTKNVVDPTLQNVPKGTTVTCDVYVTSSSYGLGAMYLDIAAPADTSPVPNGTASSISGFAWSDDGTSYTNGYLLPGFGASVHYSGTGTAAKQIHASGNTVTVQVSRKP